MSTESRVAEHYSAPGLLGRIEAALRAQGKDAARPALEDLAAVDQFHSGGLEATKRLAQMAGLQAGSGWRVLDLGGGIGGSARWLATQYGCEVSVVDLSPEFCLVGAELTRRLGLEERVRFHLGSALQPPFADGTFDLVWTQHAAMNIADKALLYREAFRVLKPGGRLAVHDMMAGPQAPLTYPTMWAPVAELSFVATPVEVQQWAGEAGFRLLESADLTAIGRQTFARRLEALEQGGATGLGVNLLVREDIAGILRNMVRNVDEGRVLSWMGVWEKAA